MALTNYGTLKTAIASRLSRSNMTALIPDFIAIAESKMMRGDLYSQLPALRVDDMLTEVTLTLNDGEVTLPAGYLEARRIYIDTSETPALTFIPLVKWYSLGAEGQAGIPRLYTIEGNKLKVAPYGVYDLNLYYYAAVDPLDQDADTNFIFDKAPHAYLYGALAEAYDHIRQHDRANLYRQQFASAVRSMNDASQLAEISGDVLTMRADSIT